MLVLLTDSVVKYSWVQRCRRHEAEFARPQHQQVTVYPWLQLMLRIHDPVTGY